MDIASMLEVEVEEVVERTPSHNSKQKIQCQVFSKEENEFYQLTYGSDVATIRFLRLHCTACDEHIGSAPIAAHNMHEHPVLRTLLCAKCREFYGDGSFEQGDDATDMFCRWCANGGNLYCCSYCSNTFCSKCIKRNFDPSAIKRIEAEDRWKCFVCDNKDLFPLRSVTRALITHIETVTRILDNDKRMNPKDVEEKMHLDETRCCFRKRKLPRSLNLSNAEDDEEDSTDSPVDERFSTQPVKKNKLQIVNNVYNNSYLDHEYYCSSTNHSSKLETDIEPTEIIIPCEQTMIEGDTEIINPAESYHPPVTTTPTITTYRDFTIEPVNPIKKKHTQQKQQQQQQQQLQQQNKQQLQQQSKQQLQQQNKQQLQQQNKQQLQQQNKQQSQQQQKQSLPLQQKQQTRQLSQQFQKQPLQKAVPRNSVAINPVPLANLLKVTLSSGLKKFKMTHVQNKKLIAVPISMVPKSITTNRIMIKKPTSHILIPKNGSINIPKISPQPYKQSSIKPRVQSLDIIDLDSDDEPVILENDKVHDSNNEHVQIDNNEIVKIQPIKLQTVTKTKLRASNTTYDQSKVRNKVMKSFKSRQQDERFEMMLLSQGKEINNTVEHLKAKILELMQIYNRSIKSKIEQDLMHSATLCTRHFHQAIRKAAVELSNINDRVVKDYINWRKKTNKILSNDDLENSENDEDNREEYKEQSTMSIQSAMKDDLTVEMICVGDSGSDSDNEKDSQNSLNTLIEVNMSEEFPPILEPITIFKCKSSAAKAVGEGSVLVEDKACQAYDVPCKDYEKCIDYSILPKVEHNSDMEKQVLVPAVLTNENFGKYQEQYLFYLQHIEDVGIQTDGSRDLPDPNHIPLKDLIDHTSPFIMNMLEQFSPNTVSNGCSSPTLSEAFSISNKPKNPSPSTSLSHSSTKKIDAVSPTTTNSIQDHEYLK